MVHDLAACLPQRVEAWAFRTDIRFVEFFGLPGIGKTTASSRLADSLRRCGPLIGEVKVAWGRRTFIGRQINRVGIVVPRLMDRRFRSVIVRIARFVIQSGQESILDAVRVIWNFSVLVAFIENERSKSYSIVVMDQGLLQGFWSILLKSKRRTTSETWLEILSAIGIHDMVFVHLRGEMGLARDRLLTRDDRSSRMQRASPGSGPDLWSAADCACREMAADLGREMRAQDHAGALAMIDVERLATPEVVAERAFEKVLACLDRHRLGELADQRV
ncbi:hypothetical protein RFM98_22815 [Mesorhizobium sp. VK9D]|uniref:hypothetical protein n=1 Tax=Mesorhizobium australafricanum TaxID=3072311 RepID=UPI002A23C62E|nr:hypothetical protein [Mesorhizobium sp. VK9D]MDX8455569.1 hypothetical protein [Mesorhizobium sp. VK9D]